MLSFPRPGATLALDFPNRGEETLELMGRLDAIVREAGGALYPAKDGRMPRGYVPARLFPQWEDFAAQKDPVHEFGFLAKGRRMTDEAKRIAILGAASAIAEAAARIWAAHGARFVARRTQRRTARSDRRRSEGAGRGAGRTRGRSIAQRSTGTRAARIVEMLGGLDVILLAYGVLGDQRRIERDPAAAAELIANQFHQRRRMVSGGARHPGAPALRRPCS